jgi:outer membrane protein OmpA-like peptidoglycan-associated protein
MRVEEPMKISLTMSMLIGLAACSQPSSVEVISSRVQDSLNVAATCNRMANIEYLPNGTRVQLPEDSLFQPGRTDLTECGHYVLASIVEAMLNPGIMQVVIEPPANSDTPFRSLSRQRTDAVKALLSNVGFVRTQPPVLVQPSAAPLGGAIGILLTVADRA